MKPIAEAICAYVIARGRDRKAAVIGKVLVDPVGRFKIFYRRYPSSAALRKWDAFSFDARLLPLLKAQGVIYVDQHDADGTMYRAPLELFETEALRKTQNAAEGEQLYLPRERFSVWPSSHYKAGYTSNEIPVTGRVPAPWQPIAPSAATSPKPPGPQIGLGL